MKPRRVAITGLGLVTPVGNDVATTWRALQAGRSGGARITQFDASGFSTQIAAEVKDFDVAAAIGDRKLLKFLSRAHGFAVAAADQAIADAGIAPTPATATRWGIAVGTGMMGVPYADLAEVHDHSAAGGELEPGKLVDDPSANDPMVFCRSQSSAGLSTLARRFGIRGYATSVHTACASGGQAVGTAMKLIRRGEADCVLTGGFDSMVNPVGLAGFCLLSAVSPDNDTPRAREPAVRFDAQRLPARRRRRLPGARGVGIGAAPRRAYLRRARRRRQFAVELPDHRLAARRRRADPGDAAIARQRRHDASTTSTTSTRTARRR